MEQELLWRNGQTIGASTLKRNSSPKNYTIFCNTSEFRLKVGQSSEFVQAIFNAS